MKLSCFFCIKTNNWLIPSPHLFQVWISAGLSWLCGVCSLLSPKVIIRGAFSDQVMNVHITGLSDPVHAVLRLNQDLNEINTFHKCSGSTLHINYIQVIFPELRWELVPDWIALLIHGNAFTRVWQSNISTGKDYATQAKQKKELCYQRLKPEFLIKKINNNLSNKSNSK